MNRHRGYSRIVDPTPEQLDDLRVAVTAGRIAKLLLEEGAAYFRRAPGCENDSYLPRAQDPLAQAEGIEKRLRAHNKQSVFFQLELDSVGKRLIALEHRAEILKDGIVHITERVVENAAGSQRILALVETDAARHSKRFAVVWFIMALTTCSLLGAVLALITR